MIESRVRHALQLLTDTNEANGFSTMDPNLLDEMAVFCASFPEGSHDEYWSWHMDRLSTKIERDREYART